MTDAANKSHMALEPIYSSLDSTLSIFHSVDEGTTDESKLYLKVVVNEKYEETPSKKESRLNHILGSIKDKVTILNFLRDKGKKMQRNNKMISPR